MSYKNLKLLANSEEDLRVISAHLQDVEKGVFRKSRRIQSILKFDNILDVYSKNINQKKKDRFLDFLAIETKSLSDKSYEIKLNFAGDILIKLNAEIIECFLEDLGESWETKNQPNNNFFND